MGSKYVEKSEIILPVITDGPEGLGDLWDCRKSKCIKKNLFLYLESDHINPRQKSDSFYFLHHLKNSSDKLLFQKWIPEIKLELLCGLIKLDVSGNSFHDEYKGISEENLSFVYHLKNWSISLKSEAKNMVNEDLKKQFEDETLEATHVVEDVIIGAHVEANIIIKHSTNLTFENTRAHLEAGNVANDEASILKKYLSGNGCLVNASVMSDFEKLDDTKIMGFEKKIHFHSIPEMNLIPTSFKGMFEVIKNIKSHLHITDFEYLVYPNNTGKKIYGIPIQFKLVPIKKYMEIDVKELYLCLDIEAEKYQSMLIKILEYQTPNWLKNRIRRNEPSVIRILGDAESPLTVEISAYESELRESAKEYSNSFKAELQKYKSGEINTENLEETIKEFERFVKEKKIEEKFNEYSRMTLEELKSIHESEVKIHENIKIFTNARNLNKWLNKEDKIAILLNTKGQGLVEDNIFKSLINISKLSKKLKTLNIEIGIALPSISEDYSLKIKVYASEAKYKKVNIGFVISLLCVIFGIGNETEILFHKLNATQNQISLSLSDSSFKDINKLIEQLITPQRVYISDSDIDTKQKLKAKDDISYFFIPIEARFTALDAFKNLQNLLKGKKYKGFVWFIGSIGTIHSDSAPLMIVIKNAEIKTVCFDNLDVKIFFDSFPNSSSSSSSLPSPSEVWEKKTFYSDRMEYIIELNELLNPGSLSKIDGNNYKMISFIEPTNSKDEEIEDTFKLLKILDSGNKSLIIIKLLNFMKKHWSPKLDDIFEEDLGNLSNMKSLKEDHWNSLKNKLKDWLKNQPQNKSDRKAISMAVLFKAILPSAYTLTDENAIEIDSIQILKSYFKLLGKDNKLFTNISVEKLKDFLKRGSIQSIISLLYENNQNPGLREIKRVLNQIPDLSSKSIINMLEELKKIEFLSTDHWNDIWLDEKIIHVINLYPNEKRIFNLIASICVNTKTFPDKLPKTSQTKVKSMKKEIEKSSLFYRIQNIWRPISQVFKRGQTIEINPKQRELVERLKTKGIVKDSRVENALLSVDRGCFCYDPTVIDIYSDGAKPIGHGATISAPHMHGYILQLLKDNLKPDSQVLDIGSGSGYLTICMAQMVGTSGKVTGIDHVKELIKKSKENLEINFKSLSKKVIFIECDGRNGYSPDNPDKTELYDVINFGGAITEVPQTVFNQLKKGGRIIAPVGPMDNTQELQTIDKLKDGTIDKPVVHLKVIFGSLKDLKSQIEE